MNAKGTLSKLTRTLEFTFTREPTPYEPCVLVHLKKGSRVTRMKIEKNKLRAMSIYVSNKDKKNKIKKLFIQVVL